MSMTEMSSDHVSSPSDSSASSRPWVMAIGGVVIAVQMVVLGMVVNQQVEQARARQAAPVAQPTQLTSAVDLHPSNLAQ